MARDITVTFEDGTQHQYKGAPDDITPDIVAARAQKEFNAPVAHIDGGRTPEAASQESSATPKRFIDMPQEEQLAAVRNAPNQPTQQPSLTQDAIEYLKSTGQNIGNIYAGAAQGAANTAINLADIVHALPKKEQNLSSLIAPNKTSTAQDYKAAIESKLSGLGANTKSDPFSVGQVAGEAISTLPIGGVLGKAVGKGAEVLGLAGKSGIPEKLATALKYGGTKNVVEGDFAKDLGYRALGGATTQGVTGQVIAPENNMGVLDSGMGAGIGAASATLAPVSRFAGAIVEPVFKSGREAILNRKLESMAGGKDTMGGLIDRLRNKGLSPEQLAVAMESPELASAIQASEKNFPESWLPKRGAEAAAMEAKVNQAQSSLNALHQGELPVSEVSKNAPYQNVRDAQIAQAGGLEDTKAVRTAELLRQNEAAQSGVVANKQTFESAIPQPKQVDIGETIAQRKDALEKAAHDKVRPLYQQAYDLAPAPFSFEPLLVEADRIKNTLSTAIEPKRAPRVHEILDIFKEKEATGPILLDAKGKPMASVTSGLPIGGSLQDAHMLRSAILDDLRGIEGASDTESNMTRRNLKKLETGINKSIQDYAPEEARTVFNKANEQFRTTVAEPFRQGMVDKLTDLNSIFRPKINPSEVADKFLHADHSRDFIRAFGNDPDAMQAIKTGIVGKFNDEVVQGGVSPAVFFRNHREALATLDSTGVNVTKDLEGIASNLDTFKVEKTALDEQAKAIPKAVDESVANQQRIISKSAKDLNAITDAEDLAKVAVSANARTMGRILHKMSPEAKPELAKQVINNAFEPITAGVDNAGAKTAKALENSRIAVALKATYGKEEGAAKLADFKETAQIQTMLEAVKKEVPKHPYDTAQALDNLTEGKPQVRRAVEDIMATINDQNKFNMLAERGRLAGEGTTKLATESAPQTPFQLTSAAAAAKWILSSMTKKADAELAERLSKELMSSEAFANALERAQQGPSQTNSAWALQYGRILPRTAAGAVTSITGEK
jgi:archaellum component FlaC